MAGLFSEIKTIDTKQAISDRWWIFVINPGSNIQKSSQLIRFKGVFVVWQTANTLWISFHLLGIKEYQKTSLKNTKK